MANYDNSDKIGNQFWKMRDKDGRDKLFELSEEGFDNLLSLCYEYFTMPRPKWIKKDFIKSGNLAGQIIDIEVDAPYTIEGLCLHLRIDTKTFWNYRNSPSHSDFFPIFTYIDDRISQQHGEGAMLGLYDGSYTALRDGLKNRVDITSNDNELPAFNISFQSKPDTE